MRRVHGTVTCMVTRGRARVVIRLLGAPEVSIDGAPLVVDTRKAIAILVVLATDGRAYAREELAALLWPDSADDAARGALRRTLSTLRMALPAGVLRIDRARVELVLGMARIDLAELQRLGASDQMRDLVAAADLARGPFLAGFSLRDSPDFDDWRATRSVAVERAVAGVLDRLASAHADAGALAAAADVVGRRIDLDPLDEGAHVRRMDLLAASGDRAAAMRQYRACVAVLERELGVAPLPETTARYEAIRDSRPVQAMPPRGTSQAALSESVHALPMVGRDATLATIEAVRRESRTEGRIVALVGEAGIGKTRLIEATTLAARVAGATVLTARAYAAERSVAYGPIVSWLVAALADPVATERLRGLSPASIAEVARLVPTVLGLNSGSAAAADAGSAAADASAAQARLLMALVDGLLGAVDGQEPGLLILDDLPWADGATIAVLSSLVRRLAERRLTLVLCWREEDLDHEVATFADHVGAHPRATVIALTRLERQDVEALVGAAWSAGTAPDAATGTSAEALWRASEGLPLYVVEALASGSWTTAEMPTGVRSVLRSRLASVGGVAQQVLSAAAAIGRSFDLATVRFASGRTEEETIEALEELMHRAIVREQAWSGAGVRYDFAHAGLRDVAEAATSLGRRQLLHRRIAEALRLDVAGDGRDDPGRLARIARHERDGGRAAEAAAAFLDAGDAARLVFANREAIGHYEAALALGYPEVAAVHMAVGDLRTRLGDYPGAVSAFEAAAALVDPGGLAPVEAALARAHLRRGDLLAAGRHLDAALQARPGAALQVRLLADRAAVQRRAGDPVGARIAADEAIDAAAAMDDDGAQGAAYRIAGLIALDRGALSEAQVAFERAMAAAASDRDPTARIAARTGQALTAAAAGDLDLALDLGQAAVDECRRIGDRHLEAAVENHLADVLHGAGREEEALVHLRRAVAAFAEVGGDPADPDPGIWMLAAT